MHPERYDPGMGGDSEHESPRPNVTRLAVAGAVAVFLLGFGALNVFSVLLPYDPALRGLYSYFSSSVGDALLLPTMTFFLVRASLSRMPRNRIVTLATAIGALVGFGGGLALQIAWLSDPLPELNWTLPAPGVFNAAGWYHAAFLVVVIALMSAGCARVVAGVASSPGRTPRITGDLVGFSVSAGLFVALLLIDNVDPDIPAASAATLVAVGGIVAVGSLVIALLAHRNR
jgi:hypothetical protein